MTHTLIDTIFKIHLNYQFGGRQHAFFNWLSEIDIKDAIKKKKLKFGLVLKTYFCALSM